MFSVIGPPTVEGALYAAIRLHHLLNVCRCLGCHQKATVSGADSLQVCVM